MKLAARVNNFFFSPRTPGNLGFCRMLFFGLMLWFHWPVDFTVWTGLPPSFDQSPFPLFDALRLPIAGIKTIAILEGFWKLSLFLACIGFLTRLSTAAAFVLGIYLLGVPHNFGKAGHGDGILVITMGILTLSRCGEAWSLDRVLRSYRAGPPVVPVAASGEYNWPVKMVWLLSSLAFFAAGVTKLRVSGLDWITSDNMANMLLQHHYKSDPIVGWGKIIANYPFVCVALAAATILLEVLFPLAMFGRWARRVLVPGMFLAQFGIAVLMGVFFTQFMFVYLFWVPWDSLGNFFTRRIAPAFDRRFVFYDGGCGICRKTVSVLHHVDLLRRCDVFDIVNEWPQIETRFSKLDRTACFDDMHVITGGGAIYRGFDAYRSLAWTLPLCWPLLPILYLPPVPWVGRKIYRYVATHRHDDGCELPASSAAPRHRALRETVESLR
jgi:predicted DCC family thiol-disulfide oxidoreductase YuxK